MVAKLSEAQRKRFKEASKSKGPCSILFFEARISRTAFRPENNPTTAPFEFSDWLYAGVPAAALHAQTVDLA